MPNIWKSFLRPKADLYRFPDAEELVEEEPVQEPEPEPEESQAPPADEDQDPGAPFCSVL